MPPLFRLHPLGADADVMAEARRMACADADPATVLCADRDERLDAAVIVHPHLPLVEARLALYVAALGLGDALGAVVPPGIDVTFRWPNWIEANVGAVARLDVAVPEMLGDSEIAEWIAVCVTVVIGALEREGLHEGFPETSLRDEGCADVTAAGLLEAFCRHFLVWLNRWQDDGFDPVRAMWLRHAPGHGEEITVPVAKGKTLTGIFDGIDDDGALRLRGRHEVRHLALGPALSGWA